MLKSILVIIPLILAVVFLSSRQVSPTLQETEPETKQEVSNPEISVSPESIIQGEPALISIQGLNSTTTVSSAIFNGERLGVFEEDGVFKALVGLDLRLPPGRYPISANLSTGETISASLTVGAREVVEAPLGIPETLGGNTPQAEQTLVNTLVQEGAIINAIKTSPEKLWEGEFRLPLNGEAIVTDTYGYSRLTGASAISHKGTDFRASVGTPVYAMNSGKVAFTRFLRNYGNTIAIDHGLGLLTIYMHLSEISVEEGEMVEQGDLIGKSGQTGYALGPHLHLTVRINNISIDPQKFMELLGE